MWTDDGATVDVRDRDVAGDPGEEFEAHRRLLQSVAYRILGSAHDAEDVLQDVWVAWNRVDPGAVEHPRAYLVRAVTRAAVRRREDIERRKETYAGVWLPDPVVEAVDPAPGPERTSVLRDEISYALLVMLESLSPLERAVFVLNEGFDYSATEIAAMLDRTPAAIRQVAHRAREHVRAGRPRYDAPAEQRLRVTSRFVAAVENGEVGALLEALAPEVSYRADGGGVVTAARRAVHGADRVGRMLAGALRTGRLEGLSHRPILVNGRTGVLVRLGPVQAVVVLEPAGPDDDAIGEIYVVLDPAKLSLPGGSATTTA